MSLGMEEPWFILSAVGRCSYCLWDPSSICALSYKEQLVLWQAGDCLDCSLCISLWLILGVLDAEVLSDLWTEASAGDYSSS